MAASHWNMMNIFHLATWLCLHSAFSKPTQIFRVQIKANCAGLWYDTFLRESPLKYWPVAIYLFNTKLKLYSVSIFVSCNHITLWELYWFLNLMAVAV